MRRIRVAIDCDISPRMVAALKGLYADAGFEFFHVREFSPPRTEDEHWADTFKRFGGDVVVSADFQIAARPHKAVAFIDNGFKSFFLSSPWSNLRFEEKASHLTYSWPSIEKVIMAADAGTCWKVPCVGKKGGIRLVSRAISAVRIPNEVLEEARRNKKAS